MRETRWLARGLRWIRRTPKQNPRHKVGRALPRQWVAIWFRGAPEAGPNPSCVPIILPGGGEGRVVGEGSPIPVRVCSIVRVVCQARIPSAVAVGSRHATDESETEGAGV